MGVEEGLWGRFFFLKWAIGAKKFSKSGRFEQWNFPKIVDMDKEIFQKLGGAAKKVANHMFMAVFV